MLTLLLLALIALAGLSLCIPTLQAQEPKPLNLIIIWHFHQPFYYSPTENKYILPWVRMHSVGNYYKMALIVSNYPDIKVTFTFTGSLMQQLNDYVENNATDVRQDISWKIANGTELTIDEEFSMLEVPGGFFDINWDRIVTKFTRFNALKQKRDALFSEYGDLPPDEMKAEITGRFTDQDVIDLAVLFNLLWIDPKVANSDPELAPLRTRASSPSPLYNQTELALVLEKQKEIMGLVIPKHRELLDNGQTEIIPSPYTHPIMPLLVDFGWREDLDAQVKKGIGLFRETFGKTPHGMWAPEMAINEESLRVMAENGINWTAADECVLQMAGVSTANPENLYVAYKVDIGKDFYIFFRDTELSNAIGFQYSGKSTDEAVNDFVNKVLDIQQHNTDGKMVLTIALDGENPWEAYINNGDDFLEALYQRLVELQNDGKIKTTTPYEYIQEHIDEIDKVVPKTSQTVLKLADVDISNITRYDDLPSETKTQAVPEATWSGADMRLKIWIGDKQENIAHMWRKAARETIIEYNETHPGWKGTVEYNQTLDALYRAEASDWCFWYASEMGSPKTFDPIFKCYLRQIYELLGEDVPDYLYGSFYPDGEACDFVEAKPSVLTPTIDGKIESGEWKGNATITVKGNYIEKVVIANDYDNLYLAVFPTSGVSFKDWFGKDYFIGVYTSSPRISYSPYALGYNVWARYQPQPSDETLGFAIHAEAGVWFNITTETSQKFKLSIADGKEGFTSKGDFETLGIDSVLEIAIPFSDIALEPKDVAYIAVTVAKDGSFEEMTSKFNAPIALQVAKPVELGEVIFTYSDPEGDDYGPGTYVYPTNEVFVEGHLDLLNFTVSKIDNDIMFRFRFKTLGGNPWNGPNGFSLQFIHMYIDTDHVEGSGRTDTLGPRVNVTSEDAWEMALLIGPGWAGSNDLIFANGTKKTELMTIEAEGEDTIVAKISSSIIGEPEEEWGYVVLVVGWDGYGENNMRAVGVEAEDYTAGGGDPDAVSEGVNPLVFDMLVPPGKNQTEVLSSYSVADKTYATVYAVRATPEEVTPQALSWELVATIAGVCAAAAVGASVYILRRRRKRKK